MPTETNRNQPKASHQLGGAAKAHLVERHTEQPCVHIDHDSGWTLRRPSARDFTHKRRGCARPDGWVAVCESSFDPADQAVYLVWLPQRAGATCFWSALARGGSGAPRCAAAADRSGPWPGSAPRSAGHRLECGGGGRRSWSVSVKTGPPSRAVPVIWHSEIPRSSTLNLNLPVNLNLVEIY
eukprot:SAG31_NODE_2513_length_5583_cov_1.886397_6_plen_182_part_00